MEQFPGNNPEEVSSPEVISIEEQAALAKELIEAANARNSFTDSLGGFEDFAAVHQHVGDNRVRYNALDDAFNEKRALFDLSASDKNAVVNFLKQTGDKEAAKAIAKMFGVRHWF